MDFPVRLITQSQEKVTLYTHHLSCIHLKNKFNQWAGSQVKVLKVFSAFTRSYIYGFKSLSVLPQIRGDLSPASPLRSEKQKEVLF